MNPATIITKVPTVKAAREVPTGSVVGDLHGGLTFTNSVAEALEKRSADGWQVFQAIDGALWTMIRIDRDAVERLT